MAWAKVPKQVVIYPYKGIKNVIMLHLSFYLTGKDK